MIFGRFDDSLELSLGEEVYRFEKPGDLEFALAGRTGLPAERIAALVGLGDEALLREAEAIRQVEQRFADALSGALENVTRISPFLKEIDPSLISNDHGWREIIGALNAVDEPHEAFKKVALVKYMQYLTSRQVVIKSLYADRQARQPARPKAQPTPDSELLKETVILDLTALGGTAEARKSFTFVRMPKGETVEVEPTGGEAIELMLASHRCRLLTGDRVAFVDESGQETTLRPGRNIIGRDSSCDIVINPELRDVSRRHLVVEVEKTGKLRMVDISSHGTSIPPDYLESTSI